MPEISRKAELSRPYTNHCLRSTAITILDDNNFASRHIMAVSGHRAESSLTYARHTSKETQRNMSHILANSTIGENSENIPPAVMEEVSDDMSVPTIETNSNNTTSSSISAMDFWSTWNSWWYSCQCSNAKLSQCITICELQCYSELLFQYIDNSYCTW